MQQLQSPQSKYLCPERSFGTLKQDKTLRIQARWIKVCCSSSAGTVADVGLSDREVWGEGGPVCETVSQAFIDHGSHTVTGA